MPDSKNVQTPDGISWYVERQGSGPDLVLIPSGEGDCGSFAKTASILSSSFTVTTFDMPGMSRTTGPASCVEEVTSRKLADQVISLMDALSIPLATFYGCSSGALAVLSIITHHPSRIRHGIVHEAPLRIHPAVAHLATLSDEEVISTCTGIFPDHFTGDPVAWKNLGEEYHARLSRNWVPWVRGYIPHVTSDVTPYVEDPSLLSAQKGAKPISWTIGGLTPARGFIENVIVGTKAGIEVGTLDSMHFPQVTMAEEFAKYLKKETEKYL